jgi:ankyrin repeat protein
MPTRAQLSEAEKYSGGHTALMREALEGNTGAVEALLEQGADVNAKDDQGRTALMFAVVNAHADTVKTLLTHGAEVNASADDGSTALMLGAIAGDVGIVQRLLDRGADVRAQFAHDGKTVLKTAEEHGQLQIVELLKQAGAER